MDGKATAILWRNGRLRYKLHAGQRKAYDRYREWEKESAEARKRGDKPIGIWQRVFLLNCSRRFGKDYLCILIRVEDCIRNPKSLYSYGTAHAKDIASIVLPILEAICEDAPESCKPVFRQSYQGVESGFYFPNGSVLRLVGIDVNADALRGRYSHGMTISEASYVSQLKYVVTTVIMPQFMGYPNATIILNSTPSEEPAHPYKTEFIPDAIIRGAYMKFTIFDNARMPDAEREEYIRTAGGLDSELCRREYLCEDIRSATRTVVPEFNLAKHAVASPRPQYALGFTVVDPGVRDLCAVLCAWYDFERAKIVIASDWSARNANTAQVAAAIRDCEKRAFSGMKYWRDTTFHENPFQRFSDTDARLILDLNTQHGLKIGAADKVGAEAALNALRTAFQRDEIEILPEATGTILHIEGAIWNKNRTDYERSETLGHVDLLSCAIYLNRHVNKFENPNPPLAIQLQLQRGVKLENMYYEDRYLRTGNSLLAKAKQLLPTGRFRAKGR